MRVIKPPNSFKNLDLRKSIFLAGSIEMGNAPMWQPIVENRLESYDGIILNPRRDDWDSTWVQSKDNPKVREQVEWELNGLSAVNLIVMYLAGNTISPISLLELGLHSTDNIIVYVDNEFKRKGNVEIVSERYGIQCFNDFDMFLDDIENRVKKI